MLKCIIFKMNLFSSFDPFVIRVGVNWLSSLVFIIFLINRFWLVSREFRWGVKKLTEVVLIDFKNLLFRKKLLLLVRLFIIIFLVNFLGLFPYIFTCSTHLVYGLSIGLPLWLGYIIYSFKNQSEFILAHFVPLGTPGVLQPFIVLIELIRNIIRPLTLRIRLIANIIAGHLLLTLLGTIRRGGNFILVRVLIGIMLILVLELGVALIQAYVFSLLSRLYIREIDRIKIRKILLV